MQTVARNVPKNVEKVRSESGTLCTLCTFRFLSGGKKMTDDREVILKVENLRTWFPVKKGTFKKVVDHVKAVDDVSLEIYKGETL